MLESIPLQRSYFSRPTLQVARDLIGMRLVRLEENHRRISGVIIETEAYCGEEDLGCHARAGRTPRTHVMYGPPGHAYVYFTYGMHWMLNIVTESVGTPSAVLIRAIQVQEGADLVAQRRIGQPVDRWTNGPAKLCQALGIDGRLNGVDVSVSGATLFIECKKGEIPFIHYSVSNGPRVGLNSVPEPWRSIPWGFKGVPHSE